MTRYGRGRAVTEARKIEIVRLYCERDMGGRFLLSCEDISRMTDTGLQTVRLVLREALAEMLEREAKRR
jgi:hypothetical protein